METLELKHLAPYLPYGLKYHIPFDHTSERFSGMLENNPLRLCIDLISEEERKKQLKEYYSLILTQKEPFFAVEYDKIFLGQMETNLGFELDDVYLEEVKPILRKLSDLTKEIEVNGEKFVPIDKIEIYNLSGVDYLISQITTGFVETIIYNMLLEWHFDVFGLIEKGLAIDINTLNK